LIEPEKLDNAFELIANYLQECYDNLPLQMHEQSLALAACGLVPSHAITQVDTTDPNAKTAWVLACCWFMRLMYPDPIRESGKPLYSLMDELELDSPGDWANTHNEVASIIRNSGHDISEFQQL